MLEGDLLIQNLEINSAITDLLKKNGYTEDIIKTVITLYSQPTNKNRRIQSRNNKNVL